MVIKRSPYFFIFYAEIAKVNLPAYLEIDSLPLSYLII